MHIILVLYSECIDLEDTCSKVWGRKQYEITKEPVCLLGGLVLFCFLGLKFYSPERAEGRPKCWLKM